MSDTDSQHKITRPDTVGVIMLDTQFPRLPGDIGNRDTWPFGVIFRVVSGASAQHVVGDTAAQDIEPFIDAALDLQNRGVGGITTSCGFLSLAQTHIASKLNVPFIASSLVQVPWVQAMLPQDKVAGILTIDARALSSEHLRCAGIDSDVPIKGCENGQEFTHSILGNKRSMDANLCESDNVDAALALHKEHPNLGAIVLECTNMAPYANAIHRATGLPVYSIYTLISWFQAGLAPVSFDN